MSPSQTNGVNGANGAKSLTVEQRTANLVEWCASLQYSSLPSEVVVRTKSFLLDTIACAIAGHTHPAVQSLLSFAKQMGPSEGKCEYIFTGGSTSAAFAALVNGAASHVVELDDLNNAGMIHPATVVFPAAIAAAQDVGCNGEDFIAGCVAGYEVANRVGEYLGKQHYSDFHTTATAGTFGAAVAVSRSLKLDFEKSLWAFGSAGTQAAGLWQYLTDATHSKQLHTAKANFNGLLSAYAARDGFTGPRDILGGKRGMAASMAEDIYPSALDEELGKRWTVMETSFKWHAACRHTHPSVDGLLSLMSKNHIKFEDIESVRCGVYKAAKHILSLGGVETVHQSKFSMGFVLSVAARYGRAGILDFTDDKLKHQELLEFMQRVEMVLDKEIDDAFPKEWMARVTVTTKDGRVFEEKVETPKGDPGNTLTEDEIEIKARGLFDYGGWKDKSAQNKLVNMIWDIEKEGSIKLR